MHARVWQLQIAPGKLDEFKAALDSLLPSVRQQVGFRGLVILKSDAGGKEGAQVIGLWESLELMRNSERSPVFYQAMVRLKACSEGFPNIQEQEVLVSEFIPAARAAVSSGRLL